MTTMAKQIAKPYQVLPKTNLPPLPVIEHALEVAQVENFFVGLPDSGLPRPQNILMFCRDREELEASRNDTSHQRHLLVFNLEVEANVLLDGPHCLPETLVGRTEPTGWLL